MKLTMRFLPVSLNALLVELSSLEETLALSASLAAKPVRGITETIPAARTILIRFQPERLSARALAGVIVTHDLETPRAPSANLVEIPTHYDGEDLAEVARLTGLSVDEVIRRHTQSEFTVAFCGFAPGFAYLVGGDPALHVPRRQTPRTRIAPGSVALAGAFSGVYPRASPGGWQIIGATPLKMWDLARDPPALLQPGTRVRFTEISRDSAAVAPDRMPDAPARAMEGQPCFKVLGSTLPALFQDAGRPGLAKIGVSVSGAADQGALALANRAAGNPAGAAGLEITLGGFSFETTSRAVVAFAGAPCSLSVRKPSGIDVDAAYAKPIALEPGDVVTLGYPMRGVRTYLAVRGGFDVPPVLGSASRDTLAAIGPEPVVAGAALALRQPRKAAKTTRLPKAPAGELPRGGEIVVLDVVLGPRTDWFTTDALALLEEQLWAVTPRSSRVGIRLQGEQPLERKNAAELPSEATVKGAVQVPHDGQPVLFLADHPLTGGYPVIGAIADYHLDLAGQIPINAKVRFRPITRFAEIKPQRPPVKRQTKRRARKKS